MLKVEGREGVGAKGGGVFEGFDSVGDKGRGKRGVGGVEGARVEFTEDAASERGLTVRSGRGVEFVEAVSDGGGFGEDPKATRRREGDGDIRGKVGPLSGEAAKKLP